MIEKGALEQESLHSDLLDRKWLWLESYKLLVISWVFFHSKKIDLLKKLLFEEIYTTTYENLRYIFLVKSQLSKKFVWPLFLGSRHFGRQIFLKGLKPKNKGHTNFYECCDLRRNIYLVYLCGLSNRKQLQCQDKQMLFQYYLLT